MAYKQGKNPFSKNPLNFNSPLNSFDSLVGKLMNQGKSKEAATKIAGKVANMKMKGAGKGPTAAQKARAKGSAAKMHHSPAEMEDLSGDGKITKKDVLIGRGVIDKDGSPANMKSPMEAHDKKLKALEKRIKRVRQSKEGSEGQGGIDYELLAELEEQKKRLIEAHGKEAKDGNAKPSPASMKSPMKNEEGGDPDETKTEQLEEVVVTASPDRSREGNKARKAKMKREGKSKREIRLAKTKSKALAAKKDAERTNEEGGTKETQARARAKANRLAKRAARQEGRAERRKIRKSNKFRENKEKEIIASRRKQQEKGAKGASALAMKEDGKKGDLLSRGARAVKKAVAKTPGVRAGKKVVKAAKKFAKDLQKRAT